MKSSALRRRKKTCHKDVKCSKKFSEFSFTPQCVQFTLAVHVGTSVVHIAFKEKTFSHEHHLAYAWEIFAVHISINNKNNYLNTESFGI